MKNIDFVIPEVKRSLFDEQWEQILPSEFKTGKKYTATWYSESPFPYFDSDFLRSLSNEFREKLKNLYSETICR